MSRKSISLAAVCVLLMAGPAAAQLQTDTLQIHGFDYGPEFASLNSHKGMGIAVNYWFSPNLVIKTGYHRVEGNLFASPDWDNFWQIVYGINDQTDLFQIGTQFSF